MKIKDRSITVFATASLAIMLTALFVPVFIGIALWCVVTRSIWELSPLTAVASAAVISALILAPLFRPSGRTWLIPFLFGLVVLFAVLCATVYSFPVKNDLSNVLFHPYGLILFAVGGLLCIIEGLQVRSKSRPKYAA
jgi:hypothetical protein